MPSAKLGRGLGDGVVKGKTESRIYIYIRWSKKDLNKYIITSQTTTEGSQNGAKKGGPRQRNDGKGESKRSS